jgi:hypothetical protein
MFAVQRSQIGGSFIGVPKADCHVYFDALCREHTSQAPESPFDAAEAFRASAAFCRSNRSVCATRVSHDRAIEKMMSCCFLVFAALANRAHSMTCRRHSAALSIVDGSPAKTFEKGCHLPLRSTRLCKKTYLINSFLGNLNFRDSTLAEMEL